jgi:hypothetical protein
MGAGWCQAPWLSLAASNRLVLLASFLSGWPWVDWKCCWHPFVFEQSFLNIKTCKSYAWLRKKFLSLAHSQQFMSLNPTIYMSLPSLTKHF